MYNNNLTLDTSDKIIIPQNARSTYLIANSSILKYTIEIGMNPYETFDLINLYIIVKSYSCNIVYPPHSFFILIKNLDAEEFMAYNTNVNEFKNISYFSFIKWFNSQLKNDWKYLKKDGKYYFLFSYPVEIFDRNKLKYLKPKYPWNEDMVISIAKITDQSDNYEKIIKNQKKIINDLENKLKELENKQNNN